MAQPANPTNISLETAKAPWYYIFKRRRHDEKEDSNPGSSPRRGGQEHGMFCASLPRRSKRKPSHRDDTNLSKVQPPRRGKGAGTESLHPSQGENLVGHSSLSQSRPLGEEEPTKKGHSSTTRHQATAVKTTTEKAEAAAILDRVCGEWPILGRLLTKNPLVRTSVLLHPESAKILDASLRECEDRLNKYGITNNVRRGETTAKIKAIVDSVVDDLNAQHPNGVLDNPKYLAIVRELEARTTKTGWRQTGFDLRRRKDQAYQEQCVERLRAEAPQAQEYLTRVVRAIAAKRNGDASWRTEVKGLSRSLDKVREYVEEFPDGDASMLVDVAGSKIRFGTIEELYAALGDLRNDQRLDIVRIKDRIARASESGNRCILMNVRLRSGYIGEVKFGLKSFTAPAAAEHPLYEMRRHLDLMAMAEGRPLRPVDLLIKAATEAHGRRAYGVAWDMEVVGCRLREVLDQHPDVASILERVILDSAQHPTNLARALQNTATRDETIEKLRELADGRTLKNGSFKEYCAACPGAGPLFELTTPSANTNIDGQDRRIVFFAAEARRRHTARTLSPNTASDPRLHDYVRRLREEVHPAVEAEVRWLAEQACNSASVSVRTKTAEAILDKVSRLRANPPTRRAPPPHSPPIVGDVFDAVGARITTSNMHDLGLIIEAARTHFGVGDGGRILEIENMYASPKMKNPAYRVIPLIVRIDVGGLPYTFELQLTTWRASIAADLEHNTIYKPFVKVTAAERGRVRAMFEEAAALDQEETRGRGFEGVIKKPEGMPYRGRGRVVSQY